MRALLALLGLVAILAAHWTAHGHHPTIGQSHDGCPACQLRSNPAAPVAVVVAPTPVQECYFGLVATPAPPVLCRVPLDVAPKTSPPEIPV